MLQKNHPLSKETDRKQQKLGITAFVVALCCTHLQFGLLGIMAGLFLAGLNDQARSWLLVLISLQVITLGPLWWGIWMIYQRWKAKGNSDTTGT